MITVIGHTGTSVDNGAVRFVARTGMADHAESTGTTYLRASEHHVLVGPNQTGPQISKVLEVGMHSQKAGNGIDELMGLSIFMDHTGWFASGTNYRGDTAIKIWGEDGWTHALRYIDTDGSTLLFDVDQYGHGFFKSGIEVVADDTNAVALQLNGRNNADNLATIRMMNNAESTEYGRIFSNTSGLTLQTSTTLPLLFKTNSTTRFQIDSSGNLIHSGASAIIVNTSGYLMLRGFTVATLPATATAGAMIYVTNGTSNKRLAIGDGTNWRFPDGAIVS
jgi:hypothetical protein